MAELGSATAGNNTTNSPANGFLSSLDKISGFFGSALDTYSTFLDSKTARELQKQQIAQPIPTPPVIQSPGSAKTSIFSEKNTPVLLGVGFGTLVLFVILTSRL